MDEEQKKYYLEHKGIKCPFCKTGDVLVIGTPEMDADDVTQEVFCSNCHRHWTDVYKLIDVTNEE